MSDNQEPVVSDTTEETGTVPPTQESLPEETKPIEESAQEEKKFSQAEVDAIIGERLARQKRKAERQAELQRLKPEISVNPKSSLNPEDFESPEAYAEAFANQKIQNLVAQTEKLEREKQFENIRDAYLEKEDKIREKYSDYDQVLRGDKVWISETAADQIMKSNVGPEIAYYLATHTDESKRIFDLNKESQIAEIAKLEVKLENNLISPPVKKVTSAPDPISPVVSRSSGSTGYEPTDPRSISTTSTTEWIEQRRAQQLRKLQTR